MTIIYKDTFGRPEPEASISVFGGSYGQPGIGELVLKCTSDAPEKRWSYVTTDVSAIVAEMEKDGWRCAVRVDGYNAPVIDCIHLATETAKKEIEEKNNKMFAQAVEGFIRFGRAPKNGRSWNYRDNCAEKGVSCFRALFAGKNYRLIVNHVEEASYYSVMARPAYRIYGDVVGFGVDGEPVLAMKKQVKL